MRSCILKNLLRTRRILRESFGNNYMRILTYSQLTRKFSNNSKNSDKIDMQEDDDHNLTGVLKTKYKAFHDEDVDIILDVSEEQQKISLEALNAREEVPDPYADIDLSRGSTGVFNIEDLVKLLERNKARDIFVASVPKEYAYVDYIVVVNGRSQKHMQVLATFIRKIYKLRKHKTDLIPKIEGENSKDWIALDLGNIALHIFSQSAREHYDIETLWTVGSEYDDKSNEPEKLNIMDQYNAILADLQPADNA